MSRLPSVKRIGTADALRCESESNAETDVYMSAERLVLGLIENRAPQLGPMRRDPAWLGGY